MKWTPFQQLTGPSLCHHDIAGAAGLAMQASVVSLLPILRMSGITRSPGCAAEWRLHVNVF